MAMSIQAVPFFEVLQISRLTLDKILMEEAKKAPTQESMLTMAVARELDIAACNAVTLITSWSLVDDHLRRVIDELGKMVEKVRGRERGLYNLLSLIPLMIKDLTLQTRVYTIQPRHVVIGRDQTFTLTFVGEFSDQLKPCLNFQEQKFHPTSSTKNELIFNVKIDPNKMPAASKNKRTYIHVSLETLYWTGPAYWATQKTAVFSDLSIGVLPTGPGRIMVVSPKEIQNPRKPDQMRSEDKIVTAEKETEQFFDFYPPEGKSFIPTIGTGIRHFQHGTSLGDPLFVWCKRETDHVQVKVSFKKGGRYEFHLEFYLAPLETYSVDLLWNESRDLSPGREHTVQFSPFDEEQVYTLKRDEKHSYLQFTQFSGHDRLVAIPPTQV